MIFNENVVVSQKYRYLCAEKLKKHHDQKKSNSRGVYY